MTASKTRWGLSPEDWDASKAQAKELLMCRAREGGTVTYGGLCETISAARFKAYSWRLMALLEEICSEEDAERGIMLASLVVRADEGIPGRGYFAHAARLGRDVSDPRAFWESEVAKIYSAFASC